MKFHHVRRLPAGKQAPRAARVICQSKLFDCQLGCSTTLSAAPRFTAVAGKDTGLIETCHSLATTWRSFRLGILVAQTNIRLVRGTPHKRARCIYCT
jgi:hypothetical protein